MTLGNQQLDTKITQNSLRRAILVVCVQACFVLFNQKRQGR